MKIYVSRHSAFYSPLISTLAAGFLQSEGLEAAYDVLSAGQTSQAMIRDGHADIVQSAVSSNWRPMERGESPLPVHFAQINQRDGFFLVSRSSGAAFEWSRLEGRSLLADHGLQPMAMLRHAAKCKGVDWSRIQVIDGGKPEQMIAAFRAGAADYVHLQGPAPQQMEREGIGHVVASVGEAMPPVAFSSLCCSREFLRTEQCQAFLRAFGRAKAWVRSAPPPAVAAKQAVLFPGVDEADIAAAVKRYQALGCWAGGVEIPRELYEQSLNVFESAGAIGRRYSYDEVCA